MDTTVNLIALSVTIFGWSRRSGGQTCKGEEKVLTILELLYKFTVHQHCSTPSSQYGHLREPELVIRHLIWMFKTAMVTGAMGVNIDNFLYKTHSFRIMYKQRDNALLPRTFV